MLIPIGSIDVMYDIFAVDFADSYGFFKEVKRKKTDLSQRECIMGFA